MAFFFRTMPSRTGRKGRFRYLDGRNRAITDLQKLERFESLAVPRVERRLDLRTARREAAGDRLRQSRPEAVPVPATGPTAWTTFLRRHVTVKRNRIRLCFPTKHGVRVRTELVDDELATALRALLCLRAGARLFKYEWEGRLYNLTSKRLNDYVKLHLGEAFTAKDFRTWGGTLLAAIALAESARKHGIPETLAAQKRSVSEVMRRVAEQLGNTPAVARASYVSPGVIEQYLEGRTLEAFRPRHLRVVGARETALSREEQATLSLLRSWRIRRARIAA